LLFRHRYLILSDIDWNLVYVLSLEVSTEEKAMNASVISVSEFTTPSSFLSFCCSSAGRRQVILSSSVPALHSINNTGTPTASKICIHTVGAIIMERRCQKKLRRKRIQLKKQATFLSAVFCMAQIV